MYKNDNIKTVILFIAIFMLTYAFSNAINFTDQSFRTLISNCITFLSITLGFNITSLTALMSSNYMKNLYNKEDSINKSITLLHRLTNYYKVSFCCSFMSLIYLLTISVIEVPLNIDLNWLVIDTLKISKTIVFPLVGINFYIQGLLIFLFIKASIKGISNSK